MSSPHVVHEALGLGVITVVAVSVLVLAEAIKRITTLPTELTRKFAHIGSGFAVLLIPAVMDSAVTVALCAGGFAALMLGTHATGLLQGVHGVGRGVGGVVWYPITAWLTFFLVYEVGDGVYLDYAIPILVLACADAMGAVVGKRWGRHKYEVVPGHFRSLEGSAAFFVVALAVIAVPLAVGGGVDPVRALAVGALVAVLAAAYESVSVHGLDNLLVPFGTMLFLERYLPLGRVELGLQALLIVAICAGTAALRWRRPATGGGFAAFSLAVFTVAVLGGWTWMPPLVGLVAAFAAYERLTPVPERLTRTRYEMGTALIGLTVPVVLVLLHAALGDPEVRRALYVAYLASIGCQGAVLAFLLPQHRSFRMPRLRRLLAVRDPWQHRPTVGKVVLAALGAVVAIALPSLLLRTDDGATAGEVGLAIVTCGFGLAAFITLAATTCARRACPACGNVTLHGLGCCHDLVLGHDDAVRLRTMTFRKTYLAANSAAAAAAVVIFSTWTA